MRRRSSTWRIGDISTRNGMPAQTRWLGWIGVTVLVAVLVGGWGGGRMGEARLTPHQAANAPPLRIENVQLVLQEQVDLPARETGVLASLKVREGERVTAGQLVGSLDTRLARGALARAELELAAARQLAEQTSAIDLARSRQQQQQQKLAGQQTAVEIAEREAANEIPRQIARRTLVTAESALRRSQAIRQKNAEAVSEREYEQQQLAVDRAKLDVEQATHDHETAQLKARAQREVLRSQELEVEAARLDLEAALADQAQARLQQQLKEQDVKQRELAVEFLELRSPIDGLVAERIPAVGEWVEPGTTVLRIIDSRRLRAEGFLPHALARQTPVGTRVEFESDEGTPPLQAHGRIVHVSTEINPVTKDVRVWAEIDNTAGDLQPGLRGSLRVLPGGDDAQ